MARVLLVEDDEDLSRRLRDWCIFQKHLVDVASSGQEALEQLRFNQYDLVVLDGRLPEMTGIEVCKEYRSSGGMTPILMLTGNPSSDHKAACLDAGATDYLQKPCTLAALKAKFNSLLKND